MSGLTGEETEAHRGAGICLKSDCGRWDSGSQLASFASRRAEPLAARPLPPVQPRACILSLGTSPAPSPARSATPLPVPVRSFRGLGPLGDHELLSSESLRCPRGLLAPGLNTLEATGVGPDSSPPAACWPQSALGVRGSVCGAGVAVPP